MLKLGVDMADLRLVGLILPLGSHRSLYHLLWVHRHVVPSGSPSKHLPRLNGGNRMPSSKDTPYEHRFSRFLRHDTMPSNSACPERNALPEYTTSRCHHQRRKRKYNTNKDQFAMGPEKRQPTTRDEKKKKKRRRKKKSNVHSSHQP